MNNIETNNQPLQFHSTIQTKLFQYLQQQNITKIYVIINKSTHKYYKQVRYITMKITYFRKFLKCKGVLVFGVL